jgi:RHS repeat-associated protein
MPPGAMTLKQDPETGLYYNRNRYYNPALGRFMTPDPAGMIDGPNLYTYARNNPLRFVDP